MELDSLLSSKYALYIKRGILIKASLPAKDEFNFNSIPSLEQFKGLLKNYLETLSNQPNTKINTDARDNGSVEQRNP